MEPPYAACVRKRMVAWDLGDQVPVLTRNLRKICWTLRALESLLWNEDLGPKVRCGWDDPPGPIQPCLWVKVWPLLLYAGQLCLEPCWGTVFIPLVCTSCPDQEGRGPPGSCCHPGSLLAIDILSAQPHQPSFSSLNLTCSSHTLADMVLCARG